MICDVSSMHSYSVSVVCASIFEAARGEVNNTLHCYSRKQAVQPRVLSDTANGQVFD